MDAIKAVSEGELTIEEANLIQLQRIADILERLLKYTEMNL